MTLKFHKGLTLKRWRKLSRDQQILNLAAELNRAKNWIKRKNNVLADDCLQRALELVDLTIEAEKQGPGFLKEILGFRKAIAAFYVVQPKDYKEFLVLLKGLLDMNAKVHNQGLSFS